LNWIIELINGKKIIENKDTWDLPNLNLVKRIYLTDGKNEYGFFISGLFFINNQTFDFKIKLDNFKMQPFQFKTGAIKFSPSFSAENDIIAWNIGYKLYNNEEQQEYILKVMYNYQIFLEASKKDKMSKDIRKIRLQ